MFFFVSYKLAENSLTEIGRRDGPLRTYVRIVTILFALFTMWGWYMFFAELMYMTGQTTWAIEVYPQVDQLIGGGLTAFWVTKFKTPS